ncbi:hypothetical protein BJX66DRAFT_320897 [Aspergillus keveii]|uniref:Mid2 domain-containing protein n=1 Tax=Aspergillus keveii TaxID=714993 RepID=A0ABR4FGK7_9EURO
MRNFLYLLLVAAFMGGIHGWDFDRPCADGPCPTDAMTIHWTINDDEYINQFNVLIDYSSNGVLRTTTSFHPMGMDSSTVLPASFLPALRPRETSDISISLVATYQSTVTGFYVTIFHRDVLVFAPVPSTVTVTSIKQTPSFVTVTATATDTDREEDSPTPAPGADHEEAISIDNDDGESGELSSGAKAGIGVGVSAGVLLVAAGGFWFFQRGRRRMEDGARSSIPVIRGPELNADRVSGGRPLSELEGRSMVLPSITTTGAERGRSANVRYEIGG